MTYSTFQGKLPVVNFLEFENKIEIEIDKNYETLGYVHTVVLNTLYQIKHAN